MKNATKSKTPDNATPTLLPYMAPYLQASGKMLDEIEHFTRRWIDRRRDLTRAAFASSETQPQDAATRLQNWQQKSTECLAEDTSDLIALFSGCSEIITTSGIEIESELAKMAGMTGKPGKLPTRIPV